MSVKWITMNERLMKGVTVINSITTKKFQLLLSHIIDAQNEDLFTPEELRKMADSFKLIIDDVNLLIETISYIVKQSTLVILKPTTLEKQLKENLKLDAEKSEIFTKVWSEITNKDIGNYEDAMKIEDIAWEETVKISDQISCTQEVPVARLQLTLSAPKKDKNDSIVLELERDEIIKLYETMETIQRKLDILNG